MFLFGMDVMGKSLEKMGGSKLGTILEKMTDSRIKGVLLGLFVTAVIQSSGAVTVMAVGFVNSGIMALRHIIGIIMGANIGTTVTAWILSLAVLRFKYFHKSVEAELLCPYSCIYRYYSSYVLQGRKEA